MNINQGAGGEWWRRAFDAAYLDIYAHRDDASAAVEVQGLLPRLRSVPGPVLDAACGNGRHLQALKDAGLVTAGFDFSAALSASAQGRPRCRGAVARGDLREPPVVGGWGAVLLLFTAFGYFSDSDNERCLAGLARLLRSGGLLVLDLPEPDHVRRSLVRESMRRTPRGLVIEERRRLAQGRMVKDVILRGRSGGVLRRHTESVRLYEPGETTDLARRCALTPIDRWRSLRSPLVDDHRLVHWFRPS